MAVDLYDSVGSSVRLFPLTSDFADNGCEIKLRSKDRQDGAKFARERKILKKKRRKPD